MYPVGLQDSEREQAVVHSTNQLNISLTSGSVGGLSGVSNVGVRGTLQRNPQLTAEERQLRSRYRKRRNRIGLLLIFATLLLFAGLVICVNTKEYIAGATISVIGVLLGSSSMVLCLLTTDSCGRVGGLHGIRERVSSYSRSSRRQNSTRDRANIQGLQPRDGDGATASIANSSINIHETLMLHSLSPSCNLSGDFLSHLPPPSYETAEILRREDIGADHMLGDVQGAAGGSASFQYYKVSQTDIHDNPLASSSSTNLASSSTAPVSSHMCEECVQRQQQHLDDSGGAQSHPISPEEQILLAPAIVVELPTYDEAIAEDR
ncbi:uncharacterized protein LOC121410915 [Lytechinus variegatus]|uniref:uncharacterized protein LOC121410915 n=1 Tax=Lytechinus variegatus TaxID=7654 RepID=UPI001BB26F9E|nr:uncharacterized protein LOC121410915 [Lytechinus variegatus]XP_041459233.1 uncharacterized protein LOC121410915 [Lytechinus variegatus]